jgi:TM2 domain-containing membrane protein YozV
MNLNKQPSVALGAFLIGLGIVWWLHLWSLLLPAALLIGGVVAYQQRRRMGRTIEGVQVGLWGVGLALLFMLHFIWPGVLFLAGASVLARGRETNVDAYVQNALSQLRRRPSAARTTPTQHVPITTSQPAPLSPVQPQPAVSERKSNTGETTRL